MGSAGFEPAKALPSDLQSDPFDRSGNSPSHMFMKITCCFQVVLNNYRLPTVLLQSIYIFGLNTFYSTSPDSSPVRPAGKASARSADIRTKQFSMIELR